MINAFGCDHRVIRCRRARLLIGACRVEERHQVDRPERPDAKCGRLGIFGRVSIKLPARIKQRTGSTLVASIDVAERLVGKHIGWSGNRRFSYLGRLTAYCTVIAGEAVGGFVDRRASTWAGSWLSAMREIGPSRENQQQQGWQQRTRHRRNPNLEWVAW